MDVDVEQITFYDGSGDGMGGVSTCVVRCSFGGVGSGNRLRI